MHCILDFNQREHFSEKGVYNEERGDLYEPDTTDVRVSEGTGRESDAGSENGA